jgi:GntR family transcriptional regulator
VERDLSRIVGVPALLQAQGMTAGSRIVSTGLAVADADTAAALRLATGSYVVDVVRIRLADGTPISLEHVRLPARAVSGSARPSAGRFAVRAAAAALRDDAR